MFELRRGNRLVSMWSKAHNDLKEAKNVNGFHFLTISGNSLRPNLHKYCPNNFRLSEKVFPIQLHNLGKHHHY